jgi:hypothetical protein
VGLRCNAAGCAFDLSDSYQLPIIASNIIAAEVAAQPVCQG